MISSERPRVEKRIAFARALLGLVSAVAFSSCGTQINTLSKAGKAGFGAAGVPPGITSLAITDSTPTNHRPLALHWGIAVGDVDQYCILENATDPNMCIWRSGSLPTTYLDSASDGPLVLSAFVKNSYGVSDRVDSNSVVIDHTPPTIASAAVTNASPTSDPSFGMSYGAVTGTYASYCINENNSAVVGCAWIAGSLPASKLIVGGDGSKVLTVWLRDAAGNVSAPVDTAPVVLDTALPTLSISTPAAGSYVNAANMAAFSVSGGCSENGRGVVITGDASAIVTCAGGAWNAVLDFSAAAQGAVAITVNHSDASGNSAPPVSRSFTKDSVLPTVAITSPAAGSAINAGNQAAFAVSGTCSENGRTVSLSGAATGSATCSGGTWSATLDFTASADGTVTLYADHADAAGNPAAQASRNFNKDAIAPTVAITSPAAGSYANNANKAAFAISGTCSDNGRNVVLSGAGSGSVVCAAGVWSTTLDVSGAADGAITIYADHSDAGGNNAPQASRAFNKDTVNPTVAITAPAAGSLIGSASVAAFAVSGTCSENGRTVSLSGSATGSAACAAGVWSANLDFSAAADGTVTLNANLSDAAGNAATQDSRNFVKDATAPTVAITSPAAGSFVNNANKAAFVLSGTCSENGQNVVLSGAASSTVSCAAGAWTKTFDLSAAADGAITFYADHSDAAGNAAAQSTRAFVKDTVDPTITIVSPAAGSTINAANMASFTVSGACSENTRTVSISGSVSATVSCAAGAWAANLDFSAVADGPITVNADHTDAAGNNAAQATRAFVKDASAPTVAITSPAAGSYVNNANKAAFAVSGTCSENGRTVSLSGSATGSATCAAGAWSANLDFSAAADGTVTLYADLSDAAGNNAVQASRTFNKDVVAPTVAITSPAAGSYVNNSNKTAFAVSGTCSENGRTVSLSGSATGSATCAAGAWSANLDFSAAADGTVTLYADLSDAAGNNAVQASRTFNKDVAAPTVAITSPAAGSYVNNANKTAFAISGTCSENGRPVVLSGAGSASPTCTAGAWSASLDVSAAADGTITVYADHSDASGNAATQDSRNFTKDTVNPTVAITSPAAMSTINSVNMGTFAVSGTCSENGRTVVLSGAASGSPTCTAGAWSASLDFTAASDGTVTITADLSDAAGNAATPSSRNFSKTTGLPTLTITSPAANSYVNIANVAAVTVSGACSANGQSVTITGAASGSATCSGGAWSLSLDFTAAAAGAISITANHSDGLGNNANPQTLNLIKDVVAPTVAITAPAAGSTVNAANQAAFAVSGTCSENGQNVVLSGSASKTVACAGGTWSTTVDFTAAADGTVTLNANHSDVAGNPATQDSRNFTKDATVPTVAITSPAAGSYVNFANKAAYAVSGTCSENGRTVTISGSASATPTCSGGTWSASLNFNAAAQGAVTIYADLSDAQGNNATQASRGFVKDSVLPTPALGSPTSGSFAGGQSITINYSATDTNIGTTPNELQWTDDGWGTTHVIATGLAASGSQAFTIPSINSLVFRIRLQTTDLAGNANTDTSSDMIVDSTAPTVAITAPAANAYVNNAAKTAFTVSGTCSENGRTVTISGAGSGTTTCTAGAWSKAVDVSATSDGTITLYADLTDAVGNAATQASRNFIKDVVAPTAPNAVSLVTPASSPGNNATPTIRVGGLVSGDSIKLFSDACTTQVGTGSAAGVNLNLTSSTLTAGSYTFYANSTDPAGNTSACSSASVAYVLDLTNPTVAITSPAANSYVNSANKAAFVVAGTCSENGQNVVLSGSASATVSCTAGAWTKTFDLTAVSDGAITINANHSDLAGNAATQDSRSFTKDTVAPSSATTLGWSGTSPSGTTALTASWTKSASGDLANQKIQFYSDSGCTTASGGLVDLASASAQTASFTAPADGTYAHILTSYDAAGNSTAAGCSSAMVVDTTAPTVAITSPAANSYLNRSNISAFAVGGTCSENGRPVVASGAGGLAVGSATCAAGAWSTNLSFNPEFDSVTAPKWSNMVAYWKLNNAWTDSKNAYNGTAANGATFTTNARIGSHAASFDGVDDYTDFGTIAAMNFGTGSFTISTWINTDSAAQLGAIFNVRGSTILGLSTSQGDSFNPTAGKKITFLAYQDGSHYRGGYTTADVLDGNWHHVVWVANATANTNTIYIDGASVAVTMDNVGGTWPNLSGTNHTSLGRDYDYGFNFRGSIDETMVWNAALSAHDVANLYSRRGYEYGSGSPDFANLRGQWKMNAPVAAISNNAIVPATLGPNAVAKNQNGTGLAYVASPIGTAINFDAFDDHLEITGHNYNFGTGAFTIGMWFKKTGGGTRGDLFTWKDAGHDTGIFVNGNILTVNVAGYGDLTGSAISIGEWHHVIYTRDASSNVAVYLDGAAYASVSSASDISGYAAAPIWIGSNHDAAFAVQSPFDGAIDDVVITNAVASLADAQAIYAGAALNEGNFTVLADHSDSAGNRAPTDSRTFVRDYVAPTVAITSPAAGSYVTNATKSAFVISGTCSADTTTLTLSGTGYAGSNPTCSSGSWTATMDVSGAPDGAVSYTIVATDAGGNSTSDVRAFTKDVGVPTVAITAPAAGSWVQWSTRTNFTVSGTCSENGQNVVLSGAGSGTVACAGGTWSKALDVSAAADGSITINANHSDVAGNPATQDSRNFNKDVTAPSITLLTPNGAEQLKGGASYNVTWTASDANGAINVWIDYSTNSGSTYTSVTTGLANSGTYSWSVPAVNSSTVLVRVGAYDPAGNSSVDPSNAVFTIDSTAPNAATGLGWSGANPHSTTSITATWTKSTSTDIASQDVKFYTNSGCTTAASIFLAVSPPTTGQSYAWTAPGDGTYYFKVTTTDTAGNATTSACSATGMVVDSTPPNAATGVGWVETSPRIATTLNAAWTKSNSADLANQTLQFYSDSTCTTASGSSIDLSSASLQTKAWTAPGAGTYTYKVTSVDGGGLTAVSACSAAMRVQLPTFSDNFNDNSINAGVWDTCAATGQTPTSNCTANITIAETSGIAQVTMPSAAQVGWVWNGYSTVSTYDLTDSYVQVAMTSAFPSTTGHSEAGLYVSFSGSNNNIGILKEGGTLYVEGNAGASYYSQSLGAYSAVNHKYLRIRHDFFASTVYFETSADGLTWSTGWSLATPGGWDLTTAKFSLQGQRDNVAESSAQVTQFDNFDTSARNIKPATFSDGFTDNTMGNAWTTCSTTGQWADLLGNCTVAGKAKITVSESSGQASIDFGVGGTGLYEHNGYVTASMYDFTDSYVQVEMPTAPPTGNGHYGAGLLIDFGMGTGNGIMFYKFNTVVSSEWATTYVYGSNADFTYNSVNHRWLRVRHSSVANKIYYETSADGAAWVTQSSATPNAGWNLNQAIFTIVGEIDGTGAGSATSGKFDNFSTNAKRVENFNNNLMEGWWELASTTGSPKWITTTTTPPTTAESSSTLVFSMATGTNAMNGYITKSALNFTNAFAQIEMPTAPDSSGTGCTPEAGLTVQLSSGNAVVISKTGTLLRFDVLQSGAWGTVSPQSVTYNSTNHRWLRIRHNAILGLFYFEASPDGTTWTVLASAGEWTYTTSARILPYGGVNAGTCSASSGTAVFDNLSTSATEIVP